MTTIEGILKHKVIAIIRGVTREDVLEVVKVLYEEGIRIVEVTLNTEQALTIIKEIGQIYEGKMLIGAGTVLSPQMAEQAIDAGAQFIITPTVSNDTIKAAKRHGIVCISGALTPTEILTAYENGSDLIKVFPVSTLGVNYIKDIQGPLPQIPLVPTGGINANNALEYLKAGAVALGVGSSLVKSKTGYTNTDFEELRRKSREFFKVTHL